MLQFKSLRLTGTVPHVDTTITFDEGVNVLRGPNFSGKSVIFHLMASVITGEMPYAATKKERDNTGRLSLSCEKNGIYYEIAQDLSSGKLTIIENGKLLTYDRTSSAQAKVAEIFPFTLPAFQNFSYLSDNTYPYLLRGTAMQRKKIFEHMFDIDTSRQYKKVKLYEQRMQADSQKLESLRALSRNAVFQKDVERAEARVQELEAEYKALQPSIKAAEKYNEVVNNWKSYEREYPALLDMSVKELRATLASLTPQALREELDAARAYADYLAMCDEADSLDTPAPIFPNSKLLPKHMSLEAAWALYEAMPDKLTLKDIPKDQPAPVHLENVRKDIMLLREKLAQADHMEDCPTCGGKMSAVKVREIRAVYEKDLAACKAKLESGQAQNDIYAQFADAISNMSKLGIAWPATRRLCADKKALGDYLTYLARKEDLRSLDKRIAEMSDAMKPQRPVKDIEADLDNCIHDRDAIQARLNFLETPKPVNIVDMQDAENLRARLSVLREELAQMKVHARNYKEVITEIFKLKVNTQYAPVVSAVKALYGPKGLRLARVQDAVMQFTENLNDIVPAFLPRYSFTAVVTDTGFDILCKRPTGTGDIRRFSGAEGKLFPLMSLLALHPILPDANRSNILILDEVEAGMKADTREIFISMLPDLQKAYPSLWLVTPHDRSAFPIKLADGVNEYEVVMTNGKSRIEAR
jgi:DNA repair exonuclease SbcCD ATPase subunit